MTQPNDKEQRVNTWRDIALEWAEETIENGPSGVISPQAAHAIAQTLLAFRSSPSHVATSDPLSPAAIMAASAEAIDDVASKHTFTMQQAIKDGLPPGTWLCLLSDYDALIRHNLELSAAHAQELAAVSATATTDLLRRIRQWDMMDVAADGKYWRSEIDKVLGA